MLLILILCVRCLLFGVFVFVLCVFFGCDKKFVLEFGKVIMIDFVIFEKKVEGLLKIVFVYVGLVGDVGWMFVYDKVCKEVEVVFEGKVKMSYVENVFEVVDVECVICDMVD